MATKYLDSTGLAYFWSKVKQYLATPTRAGLMSPTDKAKVDMINTNGTIAYYQKHESVYVTTTASESTIPIGILGYTSADMLTVDINGLNLVEGDEYTISGTDIVLTNPISESGTIIHFTALRAVTAQASDYSILKGDAGDVSDVLVDGVSVVNQQGVAEITMQGGGVTDVQVDSTSIVDQYGVADITMSSLLNMFYPVGSYYETSDSNFNPNNEWGGTWVEDSAGRVTVAQDTSQTEFDVVGKTGGNKNIQAHTHSFTQPTIESYYRNVASYGSGSAARPYSESGSLSTTNWAKASGGAVGAVSGASTGNSGNLQPYVVVNRWHRTA